MLLKKKLISFLLVIIRIVPLNYVNHPHGEGHQEQ